MRRTDREVTDREKQMEILHVCKVARIGIQDGKGVYVVPCKLWAYNRNR